MSQEKMESSEDAVMSTANRHSPEYDEWVKEQMNKIVSGMGIPYEMLKRDFVKLNR